MRPHADYYPLAILSLIFLSAYSYFLYPWLLVCLRWARRRPVRKAAWEPKVSLIVTAYNEEDKIRAKLDNCLAVDYPADRMEILVASDASTDRTDALVAAEPRARLVRVAERKGKEHAQRHAIEAAGGDVLVFTDAATLLDRNALRNLVANFADPEVGAVSSTDVMLDERGGRSGEGLYVRYEMLLRRLETEVNGLVGLSGSFFAARREVCRDWAEDLPSDFNTVLNCARLGYRAVADDSVVGFYRNLKRGQSEFQRKVRTLVRGLTAFFRHPELLNLPRYGMFTFQLISHKLMRWLVPFFLISLLALTLWGAAQGRTGAWLLLAAQAGFYLLAAAGHYLPSAQRYAWVKVPFFFAQVNSAILAAWIRYWRGERIQVWTPSKR